VIAEAAYRTGFYGEDLTGRELFEDRRLFFLMSAFYYTRYEPEHCFIAVDPDIDRSLGYIMGTPDTRRQLRRFRARMLLRIGWRIVFVTAVRYPKTFRNLLRLGALREKAVFEMPRTALLSGFPAHLHVNLLPEYQGRGAGTRLMEHFEKDMRQLGVSGIHLRTSNQNRKALSFYEKLGYAVIEERKVLSHPLFEDFRLVTFGKKLGTQGNAPG
jgi:ribosomal protein S18 acetylase RimI-like enzyme